MLAGQVVQQAPQVTLAMLEMQELPVTQETQEMPARLAQVE